MKEHLHPLTLIIIFLCCCPLADVWSNGGYSDDPTNPDYGTHDWISQHTLDFIPAQEKQHIEYNLNWYFYANELPDNSYPEDNTSGIIQFNEEETLRVGAFNIQVFGTTKASKPEVMDVLGRIIRTYDVVAIQEIRDKS